MATILCFYLKTNLPCVEASSDYAFMILNPLGTSTELLLYKYDSSISHDRFVQHLVFDYAWNMIVLYLYYKDSSRTVG